MKWLIILVLLTVFLGLLYIRLRPYIRMARRMFSVMREMRVVSQNGRAEPLRTESAGDNKLIRCDACGTWSPASRAVRLRSSQATYCSHNCLEASAAGSPKRKKTAG